MGYKEQYVRSRWLREIVKGYMKETRNRVRSLWKYFKGDPRFPLNYLILPAKKIIYLVNPKAACSSIKASLCECPEEVRNVHVHPQVTQYCKQYLSDNEHDDFFKFTFVRNPFQRIVSLYINKFVKKVQSGGHFLFESYLDGLFTPHMTFTEMVYVLKDIPPSLANPHFRAQSYLLDNAGCRPDFIGKMEQIDRDWLFLQERFDVPPLLHRNQSPSYNYLDYYDLETLDWVRDYYQEDIERFGYMQTYHEIKAFLVGG